MAGIDVGPATAPKLGEVLVLDADAVASLLPVAECIPLMESTLAELARGDAQVPVRMVLHAGHGTGDVALMPGELRASGALGYKVVTVFPGARAKGEPIHQALVALLDPETGRHLALVNGTSITTIRTGAVSAVATRHLARPDAHTLAIVGAGVQAESHLLALPLVRDITEIRITDLRPGAAEALAARHASVAPVVRAVGSVREAVDGADIVVTATTAVQPILDRAWLAPGCHVNAVGACVPTSRELDGATVAAARIITDDRRAAMVEAGDLLLAIADGVVGPDPIAGELGDVILGRIPGRESDTQITVFEALGLGIEDVASAAHIYARAIERGDGVLLRLG